MLARIHRLSTPLIKEVVVRGVRVPGRLFSGKALFLKDKNPAQIACIVAKKTVRTAVRRNRLRRRTLSLLRELGGADINGMKLIIFPNRVVLETNAPTLKVDLEILIKKLTILAQR